MSVTRHRSASVQARARCSTAWPGTVKEARPWANDWSMLGDGSAREGGCRRTKTGDHAKRTVTGPLPRRLPAFFGAV
jgi:hypothetical protein